MATTGQNHRQHPNIATIDVINHHQHIENDHLKGSGKEEERDWYLEGDTFFQSITLVLLVDSHLILGRWYFLSKLNSIYSMQLNRSIPKLTLLSFQSITLVLGRFSWISPFSSSTRHFSDFDTIYIFIYLS